MDRAAEAFGRAARLHPTWHTAYYLLGHAQGRLQQLVPARASFEAALRLAPSHAETYRLLAVTHTMSGEAGRAAEHLEEAVRLAPGAVDPRFDLGVAQQQAGRLLAAVRTYDRLLGTHPRHVNAHSNRGTSLRDLGRHTEAATSYASALRLAPAFAAAYNNLALTLSNDLRQPEAALPLLLAGRALAPGWPDWGVNTGFALQKLRRHGEAAGAFEEAVRLAPGADDVLCYAFNGRKRVSAWAGWELRLRDALHAALHARRCPRGWDPLYGLAWPLRAQPLLELSTRFAATKARKAAAVADAADAARRWPPAALGLTSAPRRKRGGAKGAKGAKGSKGSKESPQLRVGFVSADYRRHVMAFLTRGLFEHHPAGFTRRARGGGGGGGTRVRHFDAFAFALNPQDGSDERRHVEQSVDSAAAAAHGGDGAGGNGAGVGSGEAGVGGGGAGGGGDDERRFVNLAGVPLAEAFVAVARRRLHILVDLNGYTTDERSELLALRGAPVQMHAVGYAGSMGAAFVPYMLLDRHAMPPRLTARARGGGGGGALLLSERLVLMPHAYQVNDHARSLPPTTRPGDGDGADDASAAGEDVFVSAEGAGMANGAAVAAARGEAWRAARRVGLVNFNQLYKLEPGTLWLWCGVLHAAPRAFLWLLLQPADGAAALAREAAACGVDTVRRLRFAPLTMQIEPHLRRIGRAHLALDTPVYNCHTTGSDALWAGVPLVSVAGEQVAARVAGSLLRASGGAAVVRSLREYQTLAAGLASDTDSAAGAGRVGAAPAAGPPPPAAAAPLPSPQRCRWPSPT